MTNTHSKFLGKYKILNKKVNMKSKSTNNMKVRSYRMQEEFGPKKFIKP